ncbi:ANTAR domain-containing protein [Modestobacter sp. I12A-02662]|uniref:ANTAR domain-containing protein n=1 Tax=Modestobacter sp. I12A-02662 TaxID=1730496 RepID=UPI0034E009EA
MTSDSEPRDRAEDQAIEELGRLSLREHSMDSLLRTVADVAKSVLPGDAETSITVLVNDRPSTAVYTGRLALDCDESQYGRGYGPCLHAASTGELTEIVDAEQETRWPDYARRAAEYGSLSSLSVPLPVSEHVRVGLNVYARRPHAFDEHSRSVAGRLAPYAAVAVANMHEYQSARDQARNLEVALEVRGVVDQAKGILMERHQLTADQAFQFLAHASLHAGRDLHGVAEHLVATGEVLL